MSKEEKIYVKEIEWVTISNESEREGIKIKQVTTKFQLNNAMKKFVMSLN